MSRLGIGVGVGVGEEMEGIRVFLLLIAVLVSFLAYWLTIESPAVRARFEKRFGPESGSLVFFIFNKTWGFLWFGVICTAAALMLFPGHGLSGFGLALPASGLPAAVTFVSCLVLVPVSILGGRSKNRRIGRTTGDFGRYPEIQEHRWTRSTFTVLAAFWSLYLLGYEAMFRGTLLFPLAETLGIWPAIGINTALYSAFHVPKGAGEAVGAMFLGFLLCLITLITRSAVTAFLVHVALAVSNDLFAFRFRQDMRYAGKKTEPAGESRPR